MSNYMLSPVTYQGGKGRLAKIIVGQMKVPSDATFYDLCCGSGAVSLALIESGHDPKRIVMVDQGPWGCFWKAIGDGTFDLSVFRAHCAALPKDPRQIKGYMEEVYRQPVSAERVYVFLLLQAIAIGGCAIHIDGDKWQRSSGFRDYWIATATSHNRGHVNPMMPMPGTIMKRVEEITKRCRGVSGVQGNASKILPAGKAVGYIDPPYLGTTKYAYKIDAVAVAKTMGCPCWVSEGKALSDVSFRLSEGRAKGGITGNRKRAANDEWLSYFEVT